MTHANLAALSAALDSADRLRSEGRKMTIPEYTRYHPAIEEILEFFDSRHLSPDLQDVIKPFEYLANRTARLAPDDRETTVALRKLLEAKDAAVRAVLRLKGEIR